MDQKNLRIFGHFSRSVDSSQNIENINELEEFEWLWICANITENECVGLSVSNLLAEYWSPSIPIPKSDFINWVYMTYVHSDPNFWRQKMEVVMEKLKKRENVKEKEKKSN